MFLCILNEHYLTPSEGIHNVPTAKYDVCVCRLTPAVPQDLLRVGISVDLVNQVFQNLFFWTNRTATGVPQVAFQQHQKLSLYTLACLQHLWV